MAIPAGPRVPPAIALESLLTVTGGRLLGPTSADSFRGAAVDSRQVQPGNLFVALPGERDDGHRFVADAARRGAVAALVARAVDLPGDTAVAQVVVTDTLRALQDIAGWWRSRSAVRVIGITGSTGKTLAKEMVADVLGRSFRVLRSAGNQNSETGLPMSLLRLTETDELAVLEMGMYTTGEIARLAEIARPLVGVVLAVHPTHLQRAGSLERIAAAKAELPAALPGEGLAVLNHDDPRVVAMRAVTRARVATFGITAGADVRASEVTSRGLDGTEFTLTAPWGSRRMRSAALGRHLVPSALAAAAIGHEFGVPLDEIGAALEAGSRADHRMSRHEGLSGATIIDDSYNASPESVTAALDFLADTSVGSGRRLAVLGDMLELGQDEERLHRQVGARAAAALDALVVVGDRGRWIGEAARSAGLTSVHVAADAEEAGLVVDRELAPGPTDIVLVKASRGVALDRLVGYLTGAPAGEA